MLRLFCQTKLDFFFHPSVQYISELQQLAVKSSPASSVTFHEISSCLCAGSNHHPERAARSDRVHLLGQDGNSDPEHHAVQEVHHRRTELRYGALFHSALFCLERPWQY